MKYYDLNGKQVQTKYEFKNVTGTNRFGEIQIGHDIYDYYSEELFLPFTITIHSSSGSSGFFKSGGSKEYKHSLKQPNIIDTKNMGLYIHIGDSSDYSFYKKYKEGILALGCEYHTTDSIRNESYYEYSGKDYIFLTNERRNAYYIIDLETKSKVSINDENVISKEKYEEILKEKEEKIAELEAEISKNMDSLESARKYKDDFIRETTALYMGKAYGYSKEKAEATAEKAWKNSGDTAHALRELNGLEYMMEKNKKEIGELKNEVEELKNIKKDELKNEYIKYFRNKFPELENDFYFFKEDSITVNSIGFIPFKYLKPYFDDNIKTKEQFYKLINFENEK